MPSITYWNRLEPRPRTDDLAGPLAARVRDPLWFLTRQWQFGEFRAEDAGSPAYVRLAYRETPVLAWRPEGGTFEAIDGSAPLEELVETEAFTDHTGLQVELGQLVEDLLGAAGLPGVLPLLRTAYPIAVRTEAHLALNPDGDEARLLRIAGGRAIDGVELFRDAAAAAPSLPGRLTVPPSEVPGPDRPAVLDVLNAFRAEVAALYEEIGRADAPAWKPDRLEYGVEVRAALADGGEALLHADPGADGDFDWYAFDRSVASSPSAEGRPVAKPQTRSVLATYVRFRGMPNHRWWDFESGTTDFGAIEPDRRDLAKLLVMDFMLIAGNDWFVVPLALPAGTLCQIDALVVHDVFGGATHVPRADAGAVGAGAPGPAAAGATPSRRGARVPWSMFSIAAPDGVAPFFLLPPTAATAVQESVAVEEVRLLRDETANMVWGIEHTLEGGLGQPLAGQERAQLAAAAAAVGEPEAPPTSAPLRYQLETLVPENWIPFLPLVINPQRGDIALERAAVVRARPDGTLIAIRPRGRILSPPERDPYVVQEQEVTRVGTRISRVVCRSRWIDGSTHLWIARRKTAGAGEGSSGLKYDLAKGRGQ